MQYVIVSESEADLKVGKISVNTPIAKGLLGKKVGDIVDINVPSGIIPFEIIEISKYYRNEDMRVAFSACEKYNTYSMTFIRGYLDNHCKIEQIVPQPIDKKILASIESIQIKRPLSDYKLTNYQ